MLFRSAHADFASTRKRDPGYRFPWKQLADAGFGLWPDEPLADPPPGFDPWQALRLLGYPLEQDASEGHPAIVRAFHRRFRGDEGDVLDAQDARILHALTRQERSEEHTSELQSLMRISYAVFCL